MHRKSLAGGAEAAGLPCRRPAASCRSPRRQNPLALRHLSQRHAAHRRRLQLLQSLPSPFCGQETCQPASPSPLTYKSLLHTQELAIHRTEMYKRTDEYRVCRAQVQGNQAKALQIQQDRLFSQSSLFTSMLRRRRYTGRHAWQPATCCLLSVDSRLPRSAAAACASPPSRRTCRHSLRLASLRLPCQRHHCQHVPLLHLV